MPIKWFVLVISFIAIVGACMLCRDTYVQHFSDKFYRVQSTSARKKPFVIAPIFAGIGASDIYAKINNSQTTLTNDLITETALCEAIDRLEPGGAKGDVIVGYTMTIPLFQLYKRAQSGRWTFDWARANYYLQLIRKINRPVVVYLMANHFADNCELTSELMSNVDNLMLKRDGNPPKSSYFSTDVKPFTLSTDETVPVNRYRFLAVRTIAAELAKIDREQPGRVVAVTLGGECHHLFDGLQDRTGDFAHSNFTDYSPRSVKEFRSWLQTKHQSIAELNKKMGTSFRAWSEVIPPSKDISTKSLTVSWQHIDANANGFLPFYGWVDPGSGIKKISFELDGREVGEGVLGLNRMDVYEAKPSISNPNSGFRFDINLKELPGGVHTVRLIANVAGKSMLMVSRRFILISKGGNHHQISSIGPKYNDFINLFRGNLPLFKGEYYLESPIDQKKVYYNPFASEWQEFREDQVSSYLNKLFQLVAASGFDRQRVFSHQLLPDLNGSWNDLQFAASRTFDNILCQPGMTLYGGLTISDLIVQKAKGRPYGVPEMNPLMFKSAEEAEHAIQFQYEHGAHFISPYFMSLLPKAKGKGDGHQMFLISPDNREKGQNFFYKAIVKFAAN